MPASRIEPSGLIHRGSADDAGHLSEFQYEQAETVPRSRRPDTVIDEFYTDSRFDQPMIDMARTAFMVSGNRITQVK